jgi:hypothetical protein
MYRVAAIGVAALGIGIAAPASAQTVFEGAGQNTEVDCDGGSVRIEGASNTLVIHGPCTSLIVEGADNRILIDLAAQSSIVIEGASNKVRWTAPAKAKPKLRVAGAANSVTRAK